MKLITLEEHLVDPGIAAASVEAVREDAPYMVRPDFRLPADPEPGLLDDIGAERIARMDAAGIDMQILSVSGAPQLLSAFEAIPLTRAANNRMADAVKAYPDRFGAFATLPLSDPKAAADELRRTVNELGFKGALITGRPSAGAIFMDDSRFAPVLEAAAELHMPLYLHPGFVHKAVQEVYYARLDPVVSTLFSQYGWGWHNEPGIQVVRMILAGIFDKYPGLQVISGHWGEMVPFFLDRLDMAIPQSISGLQQTIKETYKSHIYVTPSGMFTYPQFRFIIEQLGIDRILYSVDYPYIGEQGAREFLENAPISQDDKEKIAHDNVEKLFKLRG